MRELREQSNAKNADMNGIRKKMAVANGFAAEQCGCIPAAYSHQACDEDRQQKKQQANPALRLQAGRVRARQ